MESTLYSCPILMKCEFSRQISKNPQISNFMKNCPVRAEFVADGQTVMTKLIVAFRNLRIRLKTGSRLTLTLVEPLY